MVKSNSYIEKVQETLGILSKIHVSNQSNKFLVAIRKLKFPIVYEEVSLSNEGVYEYHNQIFKTPQGFFIDLDKSPDNEDWIVTIYYRAENNKELKFFLNNLKKQVINGTDYNSGT